MQTLTFQNITLTPAKVDNQIWLASGELAKALNYADTQSVTKIYERNADEFRSDMTTISEVQTKGGMQKMRIFSLRGCHLIAMFARTAVAKEFRKWVLDILEMVTRTDSHQRAVLVTACDKLAVGNALRSDIYKMVGNHFGYDDVASIPAPLLPEAVAFVYELLLQQKKSTPQEMPKLLQDCIGHLADYASLLKSLKHFPLLNEQIAQHRHDSVAITHNHLIKLV